MQLKESWIYVLLGNDLTGKTTFQKKILSNLSGRHYEKLPSRTVHHLPTDGFIMHRTIFLIGRSIQEWRGKVTVPLLFRDEIEEADIVVLSSHIDDSYSCIEDIRQMIEYGHLYGYNVCAVEFENSDRSSPRYQTVTDLPWDKRIYFCNPRTANQTKIDSQLNQLAVDFLQYVKR